MRRKIVCLVSFLLVLGITLPFAALAAGISAELLNFLTAVDMGNIAVDEQGNYIVAPNTAYTLGFEFKENENFQFDNEAELVYDLPSGLIVGDTGVSAFDIKVVDNEGELTIPGNTFKIEDGKLKVQFNKNHPGFSRLTAAANVQFKVGFLVKFDQTVTEIEFADHIVKEFTFQNNSDLSIQKSAVYDKTTDKAKYTLKIKSTGHNENVVIRDQITGTALTYDQGSLSVSPTSISWAPDGVVPNGFQVKLGRALQDGEEVTLSYTATVNYDEITHSGTVAQTGNTAAVKSDTTEEKTAKADLYGKVVFNRMSKIQHGQPPVLIDAGRRIYRTTWKILVNQDQKLNMEGLSIYDYIPSTFTPIMHFTGAGIRITGEKGGGEAISRSVAWSDLEPEYISGTNNIRAWRYRIPQGDGKAKYTIEVDVLIDASNPAGDTTVQNVATIHRGDSNIIGSSTGTYTIGIGGDNNDKLSIDKTATFVSGEEIEWKVTVHVVKEGYPQLYVVDDMPKLDLSGTMYYDEYLPDTLKVEGTRGSETYTVTPLLDNSAVRTIVVRFYKDLPLNPANEGLKPTDEARDIVITFKTKVNQQWLDMAHEANYSQYITHRNNTSATVQTVRVGKAADAFPRKMTFEKAWKTTDSVEIDGKNYPLYRYELTISNPPLMSNEGYHILDEFSPYLTYYQPGGISIHGGTEAAQSDANGEITAELTPDGKLGIRIIRFPMSGANYHPVYKIRYALVVKDQASLDELNNLAAAQDGYELDNKATYGDELASSESTVVHIYSPYVDKEQANAPIAENAYTASFKLILNPFAQDLLPGSDTLAVKDVLSDNLRFLPDTLRYEPDGDGIEATYDAQTRTITFRNVPDGKTINIFYDAKVLGNGGPVTYSNTVFFGEYKKTVEETTTISSTGGGTASIPSVTIVKRDKDSVTTFLSGAEFQLFYLTADGIPVPVQDKNGQPVIVTTNAEGKALIQGNQQNDGWVLWDDGRFYQLREIKAPLGYQITAPVQFRVMGNPGGEYDYDLTGGKIDIYNEKHKVDVPVEKKWIGPAADSVTVRLFADGEDTGETLTLSAQGDWKGSFKGLPQYDTTSGEAIVYTVREERLPGYESRTEGNMADGFVITNTNAETIDIEGEKTWNDNDDQDGKRPGSITIRLFKNGTEFQTRQVSPDAGGSWKWRFEDLRKYDDQGQEITYTIREDAVPDYTTQINGYNVANNHTPTNISVSVKKVWEDAGNQDGIRPQNVTVQLYADGQALPGKTLELSEANGWTGTFDNLPEYAAGSAIAYTVMETEAYAGYTSAINGSMADGFEITNTHEPETVTIEGEKTWNDNGDQDGKRPGSITIRLFGNGTELQSRQVSPDADGNWKWRFEDLPRYELLGQEITYTISEDAVAGYTTQINGYNVENRHTPTSISVSVKKLWADAGDQDGIRPQSVTVQLYADGQALPGKTLELSEANGWTGTFDNLPEYAAGSAIAYTVMETEAYAGYTSAISGSMADGFEITNTHDPELVSVEGEKTWKDNADQAGKRPGSITIRLLKNGAEIDSKTVRAADAWSWSFTGLPKYENGQLIAYTIREDAVPGYTTQVDGHDVVNTYERPPEPPTPVYPTLRVPLTVNKTLKNGSLKADEFTFQLKDSKGKVIAEAKNAADGTVSFPDRTFSKEVSNWTYTIEEVAGTNSDITYDRTVYTVRVTTRAVGGKLEASMNVEKGGTPYGGSITFTNIRKMPKTGDNVYQLAGLLLGMSALLAGAYTIIRRREKTDEK